MYYTKNKEMISVVKAGKWIAKHRVLILDCQRAAYDSVFFRNREYEGQL